MYFYITYCVFVKKPKSSCNIRRQTFPVNPSRVCCFWFLRTEWFVLSLRFNGKTIKHFLLFIVYSTHTEWQSRGGVPLQRPLLAKLLFSPWFTSTFHGWHLKGQSCYFLWVVDNLRCAFPWGGGGGGVTTESSSEPVSAAHFPHKSFLTISVSELSVVK